MIEHNGEILTAKTLFQNACDEKRELEFICYLKGIPFTHKAAIEKVTRHYILFRTYPTQIVAIKTTGHVFIIHPDYSDYTIEAQFLEMKKDDQECVSLYDFKLVNPEILKRKKLRVVPDNTFTIKLIDSMVRIHKPYVRDISDNSICLEFNKLPASINMQSQFHLKISFKNKGDKKVEELTIKCNAYRIGEIGERPYLVAKFELLSLDKQKILDDYILSLQMAIINEFKMIADLELGR